MAYLEPRVAELGQYPETLALCQYPQKINARLIPHCQERDAFAP
jgi:hypothetical protein